MLKQSLIGLVALVSLSACQLPNDPNDLLVKSESSEIRSTSKADIAVQAALSQLGVHYRFAAESPGKAFDCSGLTKYAWGEAGVSLPHQSRRQYNAVKHVAKSDARPGDLLLFNHHVALYIGNDQMVHAPNSGSVVKISKVRWEKVVGIGRPS
jgi:cell wall-associated NlpC family hydrolase